MKNYAVSWTNLALNVLTFEISLVFYGELNLKRPLPLSIVIRTKYLLN